MTHEQIGNTPECNENDDRFKEITGRLATYVAFEDGELVQKVVDKDESAIDLPDTPFEAPEEVTRAGKKYVRRNLDEEGLTQQEASLEQKVKLRDERVEMRVSEILSGAPVTDLPKAIQTEKGVSKAEKDAIREDVDALVRSQTNDSIIQSEHARRRTAAMISEGFEIPECALDEGDDIEYSKVPDVLHHTTSRPYGIPEAKEL